MFRLKCNTHMNDVCNPCRTILRSDGAIGKRRRSAITAGPPSSPKTDPQIRMNIMSDHTVGIGTPTVDNNSDSYGRTDDEISAITENSTTEEKTETDTNGTAKSQSKCKPGNNGEAEEDTNAAVAVSKDDVVVERKVDDEEKSDDADDEGQSGDGGKSDDEGPLGHKGKSVNEENGLEINVDVRTDVFCSIPGCSEVAGDQGCSSHPDTSVLLCNVHASLSTSALRNDFHISTINNRGGDAFKYCVREVVLQVQVRCT